MLLGLSGMCKLVPISRACENWSFKNIYKKNWFGGSLTMLNRRLYLHGGNLLRKIGRKGDWGEKECSCQTETFSGFSVQACLLRLGVLILPLAPYSLICLTPWFLRVTPKVEGCQRWRGHLRNISLMKDVECQVTLWWSPIQGWLFPFQDLGRSG